MFQIICLNRILRREKYDIIHAHLPRAQLIAAFAKRKSDKLITTRHDAMPFFSSGPQILSTILWKVVQRKSSKNLAISLAVRKAMLDRMEVAKDDDIQVVHYGIELKVKEFYQKRCQNDKIETVLDSTNLKLVTVGRLVKEKNQESLIRAFLLFKREVKSSVLVIIGHGILDTQLQSLVVELGLGESVFFLGERRDVQTLIQKCDVFVLPSYTEGFGLVLLEAMQAGLPIVASNVGAIPEILGANCGVLFDPNSVDDIASKLLVSSRLDFRKNQTVASRLRVKEFSIEKSAFQIEQVYKEAL
jgi:glycosyltransferase involved in cell wall biosynthesis